MAHPASRRDLLRIKSTPKLREPPVLAFGTRGPCLGGAKGNSGEAREGGVERAGDDKQSERDGRDDREDAEGDPEKCGAQAHGKAQRVVVGHLSC